jgi:hypothetical protein
LTGGGKRTEIGVEEILAMFLISVEWLDEAKSRARFQLPGREEWRAEHIDALMKVLAQVREEMSPPVAEDPPQLHEAPPLHDPRYRTALHEFSGGTLLSLRHPSLGWLPFLLPSQQRVRIVQSFAQQEATWSSVRPEKQGP